MDGVFITGEVTDPLHHQQRALCTPTSSRQVPEIIHMNFDGLALQLDQHIEQIPLIPNPAKGSAIQRTAKTLRNSQSAM